MAEADGGVAVRDPDTVVKDIETTRENLARTIDALTERVSPGNVARRTMAKVREEASRPKVQAIGGAVVLVTVAVIAMGIWRRHK